MKLLLAAIALVASTSLAAAQHQHQQHGQSPYAGMQHRGVKALSDQQISDLRAGRGMGLALAAELNGYPGPLHVLELGQQLRLTDEQWRRMRELKETMTAEAVPVGARLIEQEFALDKAFADRTISPATLASLTEEIGQTQGRLRAVHLKYHLTTAELLSGEQREAYSRLRGYR